MASAAELESDLTSQRVQMGMYGLAKDHKWPNNQPPLGYDMLDDGRLQVNESEADLVRRIYKMYVRERSMPQVAFLLNEDGIRTKSGEEWCTQSVKKVVSNELYTGEYCVAGYEEHVEEYRIVSDELFEQVEDTRFRFQSREMEAERKESKSKRILEQYKQYNGFDQ
ncbi:recombinase family protein [Natronomonas sp. F2-12]|uniref:Recombinase family protein n=2 Tax=Natronomonas aquatica TaxID=2841590 RepID=A0A9R1CUX3_9EURY|nr:recombinase family protein [Natronomonas aquatica]